MSTLSSPWTSRDAACLAGRTRSNRSSAKHVATREVQGLLKVLTSPWLLAQLANLPGYDPGRCGDRS